MPSCFKKPLSGAQKRKIKKRQQQDTALLPKIKNFFVHQQQQQPEQQTVHVNVTEEVPDIDIGLGPSDESRDSQPTFNIENGNGGAGALQVVVSHGEGPVPAGDLLIGTNAPEPINIEPEERPVSPTNLLENPKWPSDKCNYESSLDEETKMKILSLGPCQPKDGLFEKVKGVAFQPSLYYKETNAGYTVHREWLQYSTATSEAYCLPCWLFGKSSSLSSSGEAANVLAAKGNPWQFGFQDFPHCKQAVLRHEASIAHLEAVSSMKSFISTHNTKSLLSNQNVVIEEFWRCVVERVIHVILFLATQNLALRGHRETLENEEGALSSNNCGNFLATVRLLSQYDSVLKELLERKEKTKYLSKTTQNDLMACISSVIKDEISEEILAAPFFSIIFDSTQDASRVDQGSLIFRYVKFSKSAENNSISGFEVKESFIGFTEVDDSSAKGMHSLLLKECTSIGLQGFEKLRGMGFDGAANMSGQFNGLQAKIKELQPSAVYVHCAAHNLNLAIRTTVQRIKELKDFYFFIEDVYAFFAKSLPRWKMLNDRYHDNGTDSDDMMVTDNHDCDSGDGHPKQVENEGDADAANSTGLNTAVLPDFPHPTRHQRTALKKLCATRWEDHLQALEALTCSFADVISCLEYFSTEDVKPDVRSRAQSLYSYFTKFDTVVILILEFEKLKILRTCSKTVQTLNIELDRAGQVLSNAIDDLGALDLDIIFVQAEKLARLSGVECVLPKKYFDKGEKRAKRPPNRMKDYVFASQNVENETADFSTEEYTERTKANFKSAVLSKDVEFTKAELNKRFESFSSLNEMFSCLCPNRLVSMSKSEIIKCTKKIAAQFPEFEHQPLEREIVTFNAVFSNEIKNMTCAQQMLQKLIDESSMIGLAFENLTTLLLLYLTLPVTVASAERSFSKLKIIKNFLRSSMCQDRLSSLSLISIERERSKKINIDKVIDRFLSTKKRRKF